MKKLYLSLLLALATIAAQAWTVKFTNPDNWAQVAVWAWDGGTNYTGGEWPGKLMTKGADNLWTYTGEGTPTKIIFNNNPTNDNEKKQTSDLDFVDGATYDMMGVVGAKVNKYTVYFENSNSWPEVYVWGWGCLGGFMNGNPYPGVKLSKNSQGLYEWTIEATTAAPTLGENDGFQFNNGQSGDAELKTPDIKNFQAGATYTPDGTVKGGSDQPVNPNPNPNPGGDYSSWYVNVMGPFNGWQDNGVQPVNGISTTTDLAIGTEGFKIKVWDGSDDYYYISDTGTVATDTWVQLYEDMYDAQPTQISGATAGAVYTVKFNCATNEVYITLAGGGGGNTDPVDPTPDPVDPTPNPGGDYSAWYVNVMGPFNGWQDNGVQPVDGISTTTNLAIGIEGFKIKVWDGTTDYYYISETGSVATDTWVQLYKDMFDAQPTEIEGATEGAVYTVKFNCATNEVYVTLSSGGGGNTDPVDPTPDPVDPTPNPDGDYSGYYVCLAGSFNGNNFYGNDKIEAQPNNQGIVSFTNVPVGTDGFQFKVWDGTTDTYYNYADASVVAGGSWTVLSNASESLVYIENAVSGENFNFDFNVVTAQVKVTSAGGADGIQAIEAARADARYFNLQGVEVVNPTFGIYIEVRGSDVRKVTVK